MARITKNLQVTVPKDLAERYGLRPGDEVRFEAAGDTVGVVPPATAGVAQALDVEARLSLFDAATQRQRARETTRHRPGAAERGRTRDELYDRGWADTD